MTTKPPVLSDSSLAAFLKPSFDPAAFLNSTLPPLQTTQKPSQDASSLAELSAQTQTLLATLNAQSARLTTLLTQLTDEFIRSGSRLAYQVDVLRGEAQALHESLTERVADDMRVFVADKRPSHSNGDADVHTPSEVEASLPLDAVSALNANEPPAIAQLRMLLSVRARLDSVIQLFGAALTWPPPSTSSSFISVSSTESRDASAKAAAWMASQKAELGSMVAGRSDVGAKKRVDELRRMLELWKGAAEEKGRAGVVTELDKFVNSEVAKRDGVEDREEDDSQRVFFDGIYT
jgi:hypothetical protein